MSNDDLADRLYWWTSHLPIVGRGDPQWSETSEDSVQCFDFVAFMTGVDFRGGAAPVIKRPKKCLGMRSAQ
jgi:hypothetical protein